MNVKCFITILSLTFIAHLLVAQAPLPFADSLQRRLNETLDDSTRSLVLAELAYRYYTIPDSMYNMATRGKALAQRANFPAGIAANNFSLGVYFSEIADYPKAQELLFESLRWRNKKGDAKDRARCYMALSVMFSSKGERTEGERNLKLAIHLFEKAGDKEGLMICLNNLGYMYILDNDLDSAEFAFNWGMKLARKTKFEHILIYLTGSIAELYLQKGQFDVARRYVDESIRLNHNKDLKIQASNFSLLGKILLKQKIYNESERYLLQSVSLAAKVRALDFQADAYNILHDLYLAKKDFPRSIDALENSINLINEINSVQKEKERQAIYHRFEIEENEARIRFLEQQNILRDTQISLQRQKEVGYEAGLVLVFLFLAMLFLLYKRHSAVKATYIRLLESKNVEIKAKASELEELNRELETKALERATRLLEQAQKLEEYAYFNAHKLRAPIATLLGLLYLIEKRFLSKGEFDFTLQSFKDQVEKLDEIVKEIGVRLQE